MKNPERIKDEPQFAQLLRTLAAQQSSIMEMARAAIMAAQAATEAAQAVRQQSVGPRQDPVGGAPATPVVTQQQEIHVNEVAQVKNVVQQQFPERKKGLQDGV